MVAVTEEREALVAEGCLTIREAMEFSKLGRSYLYAEMDKGRLPYVQCGRARRIPKKAIVAYLAENMRG